MMNTSADDTSSSVSPFSLPPPSYQARASPKLVMLNGMDEVESWSDSIILLFIQSKLLNDLLSLKLRCLPAHATAVAASETAYWKRFINLKVLTELKINGLVKPPPPLCLFLPLLPHWS